MFRHMLYHLFVFVTFVPLALAFQAGFAGKGTDDAVYRFRRWCYRDSKYRPKPVGDMTPFHRGMFITGSIITVMLVIAAVISMSSAVGSSLTSSASGPGVETPPVTSSRFSTNPASPVKAVTPSVPNMLPVPAMTPAGFTTKLTRTMAAAAKPPAGKRVFVTSTGQVVFVPAVNPPGTALSSSGTPVASHAPGVTYTPDRSEYAYSPDPAETSETPSQVPASTEAPSPVPEPSTTATPSESPSPTVSPSDNVPSKPVPSGSKHCGDSYSGHGCNDRSVPASPPAAGQSSEPAGVSATS